MRGLLALGLIGLAACEVAPAPPARTGTSPGAVVSAIPASAPKGELLFAIRSSPTCARSCPTTVAIVGVDGRSHAKATFTAPPAIGLFCEGSYEGASVQVAAGAVHYLDSNGAVHRLRDNGEDRVIAKIPILSALQLTSFAVSPDGATVIGSLDAFPVQPPHESNCKQVTPGTVTEQLITARVGGVTKTILTRSSKFPGAGVHMTTVVGWDAIGPVAVTDLQIRYIGFIEGTAWNGAAAHLDGNGRPGPPIGGTGCLPYFGGLSDGRVVCYDADAPTVRTAAGTLIWPLKQLIAADQVTYGFISLSPDASKVAFNLNGSCCFSFDSSVVRSRDGIRMGLGSTFQPQGWIDDETVIGAAISLDTASGCHGCLIAGHLELAHLGTPMRFQDLGVTGGFVGVVNPSSG